MRCASDLVVFSFLLGSVLVVLIQMARVVPSDRRPLRDPVADPQVLST